MLTADEGRIRVEAQLAGRLWRGTQTDPPRELVIAVKDFPYATGKELYDRWYRFDVPGVAPLAYLGYPDGASPTADELRAMRSKGKTADALLAEVRPEGTPLADTDPLATAEAARLGVALCDTMLAWIAQRGSASVGFRPETVYVTGAPGARSYAGATPRVCALLAGDGTFPTTYYGAPLAASSNAIDAEDAAFVVGLVVWFAATGQHAYQSLQYIEHRRAPFPGDPALGRVLDAALHLDRRLGVQALRDALQAL